MKITAQIPTQSTTHAAVAVTHIKQEIDVFLDELFTQRTISAQAISPDYAQLWRSIRELAQSGGKRLRPYVTLLGYCIDDPRRAVAPIIPAAAAQEILHVAMLIHDDIIDRDHVRYGVKNLTGQYDDLYRPFVTDSAERLHFSNSAAIMAGDLLIAEAYALVQQCDIESSLITQAQAVLSEAIFRVVGGELLDTEAAFKPRGQIDALTIAREKTASYSFVSPLVMGARLGGQSDDVIANLREFGTAIGVAYQLQDDLLGLFGDEAVTGKSASSDLIEGKHTHLVEQFYRLANHDQLAQFSHIFKHEAASVAQIEQARELLVDSGAVQAVKVAIAELAVQARGHLAKIEMHPDSRVAFEDLIIRCVTRVK